MKKIILISDGRNFSNAAFEFSGRLNELQPILLTGIFLPQIDYATLWNYTDAMGGVLMVPIPDEEDAEEMKKNIARFETLCKNNDIDYRVHKDFYDFSLQELKEETRFADIAMLGSEVFYKNLGTFKPNEHLKDLLHDAECPVLLVPERFDFPKNNILAYDGSASSVYAIKQFAYLFPELCQQKTILVSAKDEKDNDFPEEDYMKEFAARHFTDLTFLNIKTHTKKEFSDWVNQNKAAIVVSGSFGRSLFSQLFKQSFMSDVISEHKLPLFITHR